MARIPFDTVMEIQSVGKLPAQPLSVVVEEDHVHARGVDLLWGPCFSSGGEIAQEECY